MLALSRVALWRRLLTGAAGPSISCFWARRCSYSVTWLCSRWWNRFVALPLIGETVFLQCVHVTVCRSISCWWKPKCSQQTHTAFLFGSSVSPGVQVQFAPQLQFSVTDWARQSHMTYTRDSSFKGTRKVHESTVEPRNVSRARLLRLFVLNVSFDCFVFWLTAQP